LDGASEVGWKIESAQDLFFRLPRCHEGDQSLRSIREKALRAIPSGPCSPLLLVVFRQNIFVGALERLLTGDLAGAEAAW
jgi:hypothetical protein